jgi:EAL domain-containing protein (putative c-di-GMP-specific phosphodiesterase class I)
VNRRTDAISRPAGEGGSLCFLIRLQPDVAKLEAELICDMGSTPDKAEVVSSIRQLGTSSEPAR